MNRFSYPLPAASPPEKAIHAKTSNFSLTLGLKADGGASLCRPIAAEAKAREADQHHRPVEGFGDRPAKDELTPVANNGQIDIGSEA